MTKFALLLARLKSNREHGMITQISCNWIEKDLEMSMYLEDEIIFPLGYIMQDTWMGSILLYAFQESKLFAAFVEKAKQLDLDGSTSTEHNHINIYT